MLELNVQISKCNNFDIIDEERQHGDGAEENESSEVGSESESQIRKI